jgi:hypothetical protein
VPASQKKYETTDKFVCRQNLRPKGKGRKVAGNVKGEGGRCGERGVCEELGERYEAERKSDDADCDDIATMSQGGIEPRQTASKKHVAGANCEAL